MAKKLKHYIVTVDVAEVYEVSVDATSEEKAIKMVHQMIKNGEVEPESMDIDVVDLFNSPDEDIIED